MVTRPDASPSQHDLQSLLDTLLYSVSHDLRSPLLTMTLSMDLLDEAIRPDGATASGTTAVALDAMRQGARDLERMLQALTMLSRARRRPLERTAGALSLILGGYAVISEEREIERFVVAVDPLTVRELLDTACSGGADQLHVRIDGRCVVISCATAIEAASPLQALAASLRYGAGQPLEQLAAGQVLLERQGAAVRIEDGRLHLSLPLTGAPA